MFVMLICCEKLFLLAETIRLGTLLFLTFEYDKWGIGILIKINDFDGV